MKKETENTRKESSKDEERNKERKTKAGSGRKYKMEAQGWRGASEEEVAGGGSGGGAYVKKQ